MAEKITNLIFEFEETLFNHDGSLHKGGQELLIWLRFHRFGVGLMSALPQETVGNMLEASGMGEYFDQGICREQREELKQDPYLVAREELCEVGYVNQGATEEEAHALSYHIEAYAVVGTAEGVESAHDAGCHTMLIMDQAEEAAISPYTQSLADVVFSDLDELRDWLEDLEKAPVIEIETLEQELSVCKLENMQDIDLSKEFYFLGRTDEEISLVCETDKVPQNTIACEDGWRGFRIKGTLDFSLVGILSRITGLLARYRIGIFAVSTYNTDYVLVRKEQYKKAVKVLTEAGYMK